VWKHARTCARVRGTARGWRQKGVFHFFFLSFIWGGWGSGYGNKHEFRISPSCVFDIFFLSVLLAFFLSRSYPQIIIIFSSVFTSLLVLWLNDCSNVTWWYTLFWECLVHWVDSWISNTRATIFFFSKFFCLLLFS